MEESRALRCQGVTTEGVLFYVADVFHNRRNGGSCASARHTKGWISVGRESGAVIGAAVGIEVARHKCVVDCATTCDTRPF